MRLADLAIHTRIHAMQKSIKHIALYSSTPQQGKSTTAKILKEVYGYKTISFASPILDMIEGFLMHHGLGIETIEYYCTKQKEDIIPSVGCSYRHLARTLGTEWGRSLIDQNVWLNAFSQKFTRFSSHTPVVCDDLRFHNEAELLKEFGFVFVKIIRDANRSPNLDKHQSDIDLSSYEYWDHTIHNTGTVEDLKQSIEEIVNND